MKTITALRMERQGFSPNLSREGFDAVFRAMSPVATPYWCCPGSPPELRYRTDFDSAQYCDEKRAAHTIVKGRFQKGGIGYVFADELPLFAALYRKKGEPAPEDLEILELLEREGPMNIAAMREFTGLPARELTTALHHLQQRFLVLEDQSDSSWERGWVRMEEYFPDLFAQMPSPIQALCRLLERFTWLNVTVSPERAQSFYQLPLKKICEALSVLVKEGRLTAYRDELVRTEDLPILEKGGLEPPQGVFALNRNDFLVKVNEYWMKDTYRSPQWDVLQYLLVDGEFAGAVLGKFRNGPFEVMDVRLNLPPECWASRRDEVLEAVRKENPQSKIAACFGQRLE